MSFLNSSAVACWILFRKNNVPSFCVITRRWDGWNSSNAYLQKLTLQWRHNERDGVSNHQSHDCLLNRLFKVQIKENIKASHHYVSEIHQ